MAEWTQVGLNVISGGVAGTVDQVLQNMDEKRGLDARALGEIAADEKLSVMKQYGTYYNYGVPILAIVATAMGWLKGDWSNRLVTIGGQLAGRKATHQLTTTSTSSIPSAAYTQWERVRQEAQRRSEKAAERTYQPEMESAHVF